MADELQKFAVGYVVVPRGVLPYEGSRVERTKGWLSAWDLVKFLVQEKRVDQASAITVRNEHYHYAGR